MIGTIRKHSKWLWWFIAGATIISFVVFMGTGPAKNSHGGPGSFGTIYGHDLSAAEVEQARRDFYIFFLINYGEWPDKNRNITPAQIEQQTYLNLMFALKAKSMGITVPDKVVADVAVQMLASPGLTRALNTGGQPVRMDKFVQGVLGQRGFTAGDFQSSVRSQLVTEQLRLALGLGGTLVTPQEAASLFDREYREVSAQIVFFNTSNYLAQVAVSPAAVGQFFTNYMAYYRVPDRQQVNYVHFSTSNYLATAKADLTKTNTFEQSVDSIYRQYANTEFKDAKSPEAAKEKIRQTLFERRALSLAAEAARKYLEVLFAMEPVKNENLITTANQAGLIPRKTAPFALGETPADFATVPSAAAAISRLSPETPFTDLVIGEDGIYVIGLDRQIPSYMPAFTDIRAQVENDFRSQEALIAANRAGTNFYAQASAQIAAGKSFAQVAIAQGYAPLILKPFSLGSSEIIGTAGLADVGQLKQAAFGTPVGGVSRFVPTQTGGFVLHVQSISPVDAVKKTAELPQFLAQMRRGRQSEAFNIWVNNEAARELSGLPAFKSSASAGGAR